MSFIFCTYYSALAILFCDPAAVQVNVTAYVLVDFAPLPIISICLTPVLVLVATIPGRRVLHSSILSVLLFTNTLVPKLRLFSLNTSATAASNRFNPVVLLDLTPISADIKLHPDARYTAILNDLLSL